MGEFIPKFSHAYWDAFRTPIWPRFGSGKVTNFRRTRQPSLPSFALVDGCMDYAVEAIHSASHPHTFLGTTETGQSAILLTTGNPDCHIILRGESQVTNYDAAAVASTAELMEKTGVKPRSLIYCSHASSGKDHRRHGIVCRDVADQIAGGDRRIMGIMLESNLVAGSQKLVYGKALVYGQSITDACIDWAETQGLLRELALAVRGRRGVNSP